MSGPFLVLAHKIGNLNEEIVKLHRAMTSFCSKGLLTLFLDSYVRLLLALSTLSLYYLLFNCLVCGPVQGTFLWLVVLVS